MEEITVDFSGITRFFKDGLLHRLDGPAIISPDRAEYWYKDGKLHREGGPAVILSNGYKEWYKEGNIHREDGPARIWNNQPEWWLNDVHIEKEKWWETISDEMKIKIIFNREWI